MQQNIKGGVNELWKCIKKKRNSEMKCIPGAKWERGKEQGAGSLEYSFSSSKGMRQQSRLG